MLRFWVDSIPIRVFKNIEEAASVPYPNKQPMRILATLWNEDNWTTNGERVKINWGKAPFVASYQSFEVNACSVTSDSSRPCANNWWDRPEFETLNQYGLNRIHWVRTNYMTYDYCNDTSGRFPTTPAECSFNGSS